MPALLIEGALNDGQINCKSPQSAIENRPERTHLMELDPSFAKFIERLAADYPKQRGNVFFYFLMFIVKQYVSADHKVRTRDQSRAFSSAIAKDFLSSLDGWHFELD